MLLTVALIVWAFGLALCLVYAGWAGLDEPVEVTALLGIFWPAFVPIVLFGGFIMFFLLLGRSIRKGRNKH